MADDFDTLRVKVETKKKVDILAAITEANKYDLVGGLVDALWRDAVKAGLVKDSMLKATGIPEAQQ